MSESKSVSNQKGRSKKHNIPYTGDTSSMQAAFQEYLSCVADCFGEPYDDRDLRSGDEPSLRSVCEEFNISIPKARKLLITVGVYSTEQSRQVAELYAQGKSISEIGGLTGLKRSSVSSYLPYKRFSYKMDDTSDKSGISDGVVSRHTEDSRKYRERRKTVQQLQENIKAGKNAEDFLWQAVIAYQGYPFHTSSGLPFSYTVKRNKIGTYTGELIVSRKEGSKTLTRSSLMLAFHTVLEGIEIVDVFDKNGEMATVLTLPEYKGPKSIGQIFGISYVYSLFWKLGLIMLYRGFQ